MIWAHTLVKNEGRWLWYSVTSVVNHIDKILLWDTGSTDETVEIERQLEKLYPDKIVLKQRNVTSPGDFAEARQEMLDETDADWFLVLDGDEIWWEESIKMVTDFISKDGGGFESVIVPTINAVGDVFHYQGREAGRYKFGNRTGHFNLRAINRNIPGLKSEGAHGVWGWIDGEGIMIQDRNPNKIKFLDAPYLHTTHLKRSTDRKGDRGVLKRKMKLKYEIGRKFPLDFYYPEAFFWGRPEFVESPWQVMDVPFVARAIIETPLRYLKRKIWWGRAGY